LLLKLNGFDGAVKFTLFGVGANNETSAATLDATS
jgi:hypothetical protein